MAKAVFLDRDGTINVEKNYLYRPEDFEFITGVLEGLKMLQDAGYMLVVITNQSGIARGYYTEADLQRLNKWMLDRLDKYGISISGIYYCPHHPQAAVERYRVECGCRKPAIGLFMRAVYELGIDLDQSFAIGDKLRDCAICESTGCKGFLIGENESPQIIESVRNGGYRNLRYGKDLLECASEIVGCSENK